MSKDYFAPGADSELLAFHQLNSFESLWALKLDTVDEPNTSRGGWSSVYRLELKDAEGGTHGYYLKRQDNHLTRTVRKPFGEPTFSREYRAIKAYQRDQVPALDAIVFAQRTHRESKRALLLTRALDEYESLDYWLGQWDTLPWKQKEKLIRAAADVVRRLHHAKKVHRCLYPKHVFIKVDSAQARARLIDLEKTRRAWLGRYDVVADLASLSRRSLQPSRTDRLRFLLAYLNKSCLDQEVRRWVGQINKRILRKAAS